MSEIEIYEKRLKQARAREAETFAVAVAALKEAIGSAFPSRSKNAESSCQHAVSLHDASSARQSTCSQQWCDGMGNCPVETLVATDTATAVADAFDPAVLEATAEATADAAEPAIQPVAAIIVTGDAALEGSAPSSIPVPAAEDETTGEAQPVLSRKDRVGEASTAIGVEVTSSTVAVPGQPVEDEPTVTGSITEPLSNTPVSMLDGRNCYEEF